MQCTLLFFLTGTAAVADISALNASLLKPDIKSVSHSASWLSSLLSMLGVMMLRIAFTFLCLTAAEPCSEFDPFCAAKGHELLQRQKLLKMETENLMSYEEFEASVKDSYATGQKRLKRSDFLVERTLRASITRPTVPLRKMRAAWKTCRKEFTILARPPVWLMSSTPPSSRLSWRV